MVDVIELSDDEEGAAELRAKPKPQVKYTAKTKQSGSNIKPAAAPSEAEPPAETIVISSASESTSNPAATKKRRRGSTITKATVKRSSPEKKKRKGDTTGSSVQSEEPDADTICPPDGTLWPFKMQTFS